MTIVKTVLVFVALSCFSVARADCKQFRVCDASYNCETKTVCSDQDSDSPHQDTAMDKARKQQQQSIDNAGRLFQ